MTEYQYYEFQAIDRPLTSEEQQAVARLSSRVEPHPRRAVFTYSFGGGLSLRAEDLLARYYDAMLYLASWGSRQLMFRFPRELIDLDQMQQYAAEFLGSFVNAIRVGTESQCIVLNIDLGEEGGLGWIVGEGWLDSLIGLRDAILRRDYRVLYLAWLKGIATGHREDDDDLEPPVPPGLQTLTPALERFVELFDIDEDLVRVATEQSRELGGEIADGDLCRAIEQLSVEERNSFLLRLARGEPHLTLTLNRRLGTLNGGLQEDVTERRTTDELLARVEALRERRCREHAAEAETRRIAELMTLAERVDDAWHQADVLIQRSQAKAYEEAVQLLKDLRDLAEYQNRWPAFEGRLVKLCDQYSRRRSLMRRLREAGLIDRREID
jgi:hypothetical protein